jgi:Family of unknown function (DUF6220)
VSPAAASRVPDRMSVTQQPPGPEQRPVVEHTAGPSAATGWRRAAGIAYVVLAVLFILSVFVQFFLAGLGTFGAESFEAHKDFAGVFHLFALLLVVVALLVRRNRVDLTLVIALFVLTTVQFSLPEASDGYVQALHVLNALIIYTLAYHVMQRSFKSVREA